LSLKMQNEYDLSIEGWGMEELPDGRIDVYDNKYFFQEQFKSHEELAKYIKLHKILGKVDKSNQHDEVDFGTMGKELL